MRGMKCPLTGTGWRPITEGLAVYHDPRAGRRRLAWIAYLSAEPGPAATGLALVRRTLDGLLGLSPATGWDDTAYALKGTGRKELTPQDRAILADLADRFPLFG
jgi:hypothetical protein